MECRAERRTLCATRGVLMRRAVGPETRFCCPSRRRRMIGEQQQRQHEGKRTPGWPPRAGSNWVDHEVITSIPVVGDTKCHAGGDTTVSPDNASTA